MTHSEDKTSILEKVSFETSLELLQKAVRKLESGELNLEESLKHFEEGVKLTRVCQEYLAAAEQRVEVLMKANDQKIETQSFTTTFKS
jgi:exodeoxyribonuclease VII small subunit